MQMTIRSTIPRSSFLPLSLSLSLATHVSSERQAFLQGEHKIVICFPRHISGKDGRGPCIWVPSSEFMWLMAGQSDPSLSIFSFEEVEFLAEDELVDVVPNMRMDALNLISGDFGPFSPQIPTKVPLWLAIALKKRGKCSIRPPEWMSVERLTLVLEAERESPREFQPLPFHYIEISKLLFENAHEDIPDLYMVRSFIEDIRGVRFHKVETGLGTISGRTHAVKLKNLSAVEVNIIRPFMMRALQVFYKLDSPEMIQQPESTVNSHQVLDRGPRRNLRPR